MTKCKACQLPLGGGSLCTPCHVELLGVPVRVLQTRRGTIIAWESIHADPRGIDWTATLQAKEFGALVRAQRDAGVYR